MLAQHLPREGVAADLKNFEGTLAEGPELRQVFENPSIPHEQKVRLLDAIAARLGTHRAVRNFLAVIIDHGRLEGLEDINKAYLERADQDTGITEAEVTSARPLDEQGRRLLEEGIARLAGGASVRATYHEDPALLGGAVVRVGSTVYDGSVRGQLEQMRLRMVGAAS